MAETNLKSYLYYTIFALFVFSGIFFIIQETSNASGISLTDDYANNATVTFKEQLSDHKTKTQNATDLAIKTTGDSDANDIQGSWLIGGFQRVREIAGGTTKLTKTGFNVMDKIFTLIKPPEFMQTAAFLWLTVTILLIVLAIIIERQGVTK